MLYKLGPREPTSHLGHPGRHCTGARDFGTPHQPIDKGEDRQHLQTILLAFTKILHNVQPMSESPDEEDEEAPENVKARVLYQPCCGTTKLNALDTSMPPRNAPPFSSACSSGMATRGLIFRSSRTPCPRQEEARTRNSRLWHG